MYRLNYGVIQMIERYQRELEQLDERIGECLQVQMAYPTMEGDRMIGELELDRYHLQQKIDMLEISDVDEIKYDLYH